MSTVRDAYQPPVSSSLARKFWLRFTLLAMLLVIAVGAMLYTVGQIRRDALIREMNSNRRPAPLIPNTTFDGTLGAEQQTQ